MLRATREILLRRPPPNSRGQAKAAVSVTGNPDWAKAIGDAGKPVVELVTADHSVIAALSSRKYVML